MYERSFKGVFEFNTLCMKTVVVVSTKYYTVEVFSIHIFSMSRNLATSH